ncbi:MAG: TetR/AcrR family transcriptional regulator [Deltaproteobacteria bacterium]|nr:TetR/AcrR family transcriptional regulator [Deltaproteobacteria bacterium]MBW2359768.1 TetR/AcrR family transcriptional regulator [Deltaproteobacteria bacterium]
MPRREEKKAESRRRILESARDVFFRDGFMQANLDEVAEKAGVAKGTLYRYFESKAELYVAVLAHNGAIFEQKFRETLDDSLAAPEQVRRTARFYFDHYVGNRDYFQIFWAIENQPVIGELPQAVVDEVSRLWERCLTILAGTIERGVEEGAFLPCDSWEVANLLWTVGNGLIQSERSATRRMLRRAALDTAFEDAVEIILRGLRP